MITQAITNPTPTKAQKQRETYIKRRWRAYLVETAQSDSQAQLQTLKMAKNGANIILHIDKTIRPNYPELALPFELWLEFEKKTP